MSMYNTGLVLQKIICNVALWHKKKDPKEKDLLQHEMYNTLENAAQSHLQRFLRFATSKNFR